MGRGPLEVSSPTLGAGLSPVLAQGSEALAKSWKYGDPLHCAPSQDQEELGSIVFAPPSR